MSLRARRALGPGLGGLFGSLVVGLTASGPAIAADSDSSGRTIEEVVVTARRQDETLQDVPVTITSVGGEQLENFQLDQPAEIAERIPNFRIQTGGSGSGGTLNLRGVGSSAISAAFDSAVAFDIDGVQVSRMRMVQAAFMDLAQVDVLKGPQSLYFGKSASAGVISFRSANPGEELEAKVGAGYDYEQESSYIDGFISGPLTDTLGARLAVRYAETDNFHENNAPGVAAEEFGEEDFNARLTLAWDPSDTVSLNWKTTYTDHEGTNAIGKADILCQGETAQATNFGGGQFPSGHDCDPFDGVTQVGDIGPVHGANFQGRDNPDPFEELETLLTRVQLDWDINDNMTLTSVTSYFELIEEGSASYGYDINGFGSNITNNETEAFAQELRLAGQFNDSASFLLGAFYQDRELLFDTSQHAIGAAQFGPIFGLTAADPATGFTDDWRKIHTTDSTTFSLFGSVTVQLTEKLEFTGGARWSDEERTQVIDVPFIHAVGGIFGFVPSGFSSGDIEFDDTEVSPEASLLYALTDEVNLFAAYKTGYKAGGSDNSALPSSSLSAAAADGDFSELIYETETGEGFEVGMKGRFMEGAMRLDVTAFRYVYEDLQVQTFNPVAIQFATSNAGELTSQGIEVDVTWLPNIDGLSIYGSGSVLSAKFTDTFAPQGEDLNGREASGAADLAFNVGFDYTQPLTAEMNWGFGFNTSFSDEFETNNGAANGFIQEAFWLVNARAFVGASDGRWQASVSGRNLTDEITVVTSGGRPFANTVNDGGVADQILNLTRGRQVFANFEVRF